MLLSELEKRVSWGGRCEIGGEGDACQQGGFWCSVILLGIFIFDFSEKVGQTQEKHSGNLEIENSKNISVSEVKVFLGGHHHLVKSSLSFQCCCLCLWQGLWQPHPLCWAAPPGQAAQVVPGPSTAARVGGVDTPGRLCHPWVFPTEGLCCGSKLPEGKLYGQWPVRSCLKCHGSWWVSNVILCSHGLVSAFVAVCLQTIAKW